MRIFVLPFLVSPSQYTEFFSFFARRDVCDGQCTYCQEASIHHVWSFVRTLTGSYVFERQFNDSEYFAAGTPPGVRHRDIQSLMEWSWRAGVHFECVPGIIAMRLLTFEFTNPRQFMEPKVLDLLDALNCHTGILDMLHSSWPALLAGGWSVFQQLAGVSRKFRHIFWNFDADNPDIIPLEHRSITNEYPGIIRNNTCDFSSTDFDHVYIRNIRSTLKYEEVLPVSFHLGLLVRRPECVIGSAVALLGMALNLIDTHHIYQGSLQDDENTIITLITATQEMVIKWTQDAPNKSRWFDLLTTDWPLWEMLGRLTCVNSSRSCITRSEVRCFDVYTRNFVPCPYKKPLWKFTYVMCGEHDVCDKPSPIEPREWCVPWNTTRKEEPWVLTLNHDAEERLCSQCGQDGVIKFIFQHIGFRLPDEPPFYVEFGARKPHMLNSAWVRSVCDWRGLLMDSQPGLTPHGGCGEDCPGLDLVKQEFITAENVNRVFAKYDVPDQFDILTIDIDFNDYWIWKSLLEKGRFRPRVVAVDFNADVDLSEAKTVMYNASAEWDGTRYTTASLLAYTLLAHQYAYSYVASLEMGAHAFFVRQDLLHPDDRNRPLKAPRKQAHAPDRKNRDFMDTVYQHLVG
eukprot:GEMP01017297.1.p1 GENE.GEMP01017297.1~~GEMP01017297.1.p1  ORF type:complete len:627 (+),score=106.17 GEMP01017297.1:65-1945(+)